MTDLGMDGKSPYIKIGEYFSTSSWTLEISSSVLFSLPHTLPLSSPSPIPLVYRTFFDKRISSIF